MDPITPESKFAVIAEAKDNASNLMLKDMTFGRLVDDVLMPFEKKETIWIDGYPLTTDKIRRLKIVRQKDGFSSELSMLNRHLNWGDTSSRKVYGDQYQTRVQAIFDYKTEDVTAQVFNAFSIKIKPSIKEYLPKRDELVSAAVAIFVESMKALNK
jgi:hypothetical protein